MTVGFASTNWITIKILQPKPKTIFKTSMAFCSSKRKASIIMQGTLHIVEDNVAKSKPNKSKSM